MEYNEVYKNALVYFKNDDLAAATWATKYAMRNDKGSFVESSPDEMHRRMSVEFARIERNYRHKDFDGLSDYGRNRTVLTESAIYELFKDFKYLIPQGSVMSALGNPFLVASLSNCVVLPEIHDSYGGIFYTDQQMAQLFKRRCGVGIDISTLRPSGLHVSNAAGTTSGAVSFMERFSNTTREVAQHGRRGALMITMDVRHPDIMEFIRIKQDLTKVTGANVSVRLTDKFMEAVKDDKTFLLQWPVESSAPSITRKVRALEMWNAMIDSAHSTAEPGLLFWDRQHSYSTSSQYPGFKNVSTNPCSEIAMQGGDSCRLIAVNLLSFVKEPFTSQASFDKEKFYSVCYEAQRLMDDLVDLELEMIDKILSKVEHDPEPLAIKSTEMETWKLLRDTGASGRRTGLGFTALADMLAACNYKFSSDEAIEFTEQIMRIKCRAEFDSSIDMAIQRGRFNAFDTTVENSSGFIQMLSKEFPDVYARMMKHGRRNISISTVAPTGSLSILAGTSSGIEPVFMTRYKRRRKVDPSMKNARIDFVDESGDSWQEYEVTHPGLRSWLENHPGKEESNSPYFMNTSESIDWQKRIRLQAVVQKYTTHSISSTINLPEDTPADIVAKIYMTAWEEGLKGITVYRAGSRSGVLVSDSEMRDKASVFRETVAPVRPMTLEAKVIRFLNHRERWIAFVGLLEDRPYEIFTGKEEDSFLVPDHVTEGRIIRVRLQDGSKRYDFEYIADGNDTVRIEGLSRSFNKEYWNYAKLISGILRHGMPLPQVIDLISNLDLGSESINNWKKGVERALKQFIPPGTAVASALCPECGDPDGLIYEEGCVKCRSCLMSRCG